MSIGFEVVLMLHIGAAIVAVGPLFAYPALRRADALPAAAQLHTRVTVPSLALVGVLGFGLMGLSDDTFTFDQPWIRASIATWLALVAIALLVLARGLRDGNTSRISLGLSTSHVLVVVALYLMVFQPGL